MKKTPLIGVRVLDTLTTGMYTKPFDCLRELVQNAFDAIRQAERAGIIKQGQGRVEITIDPDRRSLIVRDNGVGIPSQEAYQTLANVGMSTKDLKYDAGFRGIGRLASVAYSESLYFRTSGQNETHTAEVLLDCIGLRNTMSPKTKHVEQLSEVIMSNSDVEIRNAKKQEHFFEVELQGITPGAEDFLDWQKMEEYLGQVLPVKFNDQQFFHGKKIQKWCVQHGLELPTVQVVFKGVVEREIFKPYKNHYRSINNEHKISVDGIRFFPESPSSDSPFWLWYAETPLLGSISDPKVAGFRLRKHNIGIGGADRCREIFGKTASSNERFNGYYIGEVHVLSPDVIPNARRDGFEDGNNWEAIREELAVFFNERIQDVRKLSQARNRPVEKVTKTAESIIAKTREEINGGLVSKDQKCKLLKKIQKEEERVALAVGTRKGKPEATRLSSIAEELAATKRKLELENNFAVKMLKSNLDRKQRRVIKDILVILHEALDDQTFEKAKRAILDRFQVGELGGEE